MVATLVAAAVLLPIGPRSAPEEPTAAEDRRLATVLDHADHPFPAVTGETALDGMIGEAYAELLLADDDPGNAADDARQARAEELIAALRTAGYPPITDPDEISDWPGVFSSPALFSMWVDHPELRARVSPGSHFAMAAMITDYVEALCRPTSLELQPALADPWFRRGTENHMIMRRVNCLLGTWYLDTTTGGYPEWARWRDHLVAFLQERAKTGLFEEVASPQYGRYSVASILALADFPGDPELARLATAFLDLFWHDVAHDFDRRTGVAGAAGTRMYQPIDEASDESGVYSRATQHWTREWTYLYGWHDADPGARTHPVILVAAASGYEPLALSRDLATMTGKAYAYSSRRPGRADATRGDDHFVRRDVEVNDDFISGAITYDPAHAYVQSAVETMWFATLVSDPADPDERLVVSGIGEPDAEGTVRDWGALTGTAHEHVILAARATAAAGSRGVRVYLGHGALCRNLTLDPGSGWRFTRSANTYVAIMVPEPGVDTVRGACDDDPDGAVSLRVDGREDIWTPIVVQLARAGDVADFAAFQRAVIAQPLSYTDGVLTYESLDGHRYDLARQEDGASLPRIDGAPLDLTPPYAYRSPYIDMAWPDDVVTVRGPDGDCRILDFSSPPGPPAVC